MMQLDVRTADVVTLQQLLVSMITPRPVAWVTTVDRDGRVNLAPFSFFNVFGSNPPVVVFSPTNRRDSSKKDTLLNLEEVPEFVLNAAVWPLAEAVNATSRELPRGVNEADEVGLDLVPAVKVRPPRVRQSPIHLEGKVRQIIPVGQGPASGNLVLGELLYFHIDDAVLDEQGRVDPRKLQTIARLGADWFCRTTDLFELKRPT
jgi:flavin reductase (DIM6/NTAB) family NADH-FMN oxidoreductase RutF